MTSAPVTELLLAWGRGDDTALDCLVPIVESELRRVARRYMGGERAGHTLQPTALVNEAYLRLVNIKQVSWQGRAHFFGLAARLMRRILVDHARSRQYLKRGGGAQKVELDDTIAAKPAPDLIALNDALDALAEVDPRRSQVVELRFFGGLGVDETAAALNVSPETVMRDWKVARAWLLRELKRETR